MPYSPLALSVSAEKWWIMNLTPLASTQVMTMHIITAMKRITVITEAMPTSMQCITEDFPLHTDVHVPIMEKSELIHFITFQIIATTIKNYAEYIGSIYHCFQRNSQYSVSIIQ